MHEICADAVLGRNARSTRARVLRSFCPARDAAKFSTVVEIARRGMLFPYDGRIDFISPSLTATGGKEGTRQDAVRV